MKRVKRIEMVAGAMESFEGNHMNLARCWVLLRSITNLQCHLHCIRRYNGCVGLKKESGGSHCIMHTFNAYRDRQRGIERVFHFSVCSDVYTYAQHREQMILFGWRTLVFTSSRLDNIRYLFIMSFHPLYCAYLCAMFKCAIFILAFVEWSGAIGIVWSSKPFQWLVKVLQLLATITEHPTSKWQLTYIFVVISLNTSTIDISININNSSKAPFMIVLLSIRKCDGIGKISFGWNFFPGEI